MTHLNVKVSDQTDTVNERSFRMSRRKSCKFPEKYINRSRTVFSVLVPISDPNLLNAYALKIVL